VVAVSLRSRFAKEFKLEAVRLPELGEKPATKPAAELIIRQRLMTTSSHIWPAGSVCVL